MNKINDFSNKHLQRTVSDVEVKLQEIRSRIFGYRNDVSITPMRSPLTSIDRNQFQLPAKETDTNRTQADTPQARSRKKSQRLGQRKFNEEVGDKENGYQYRVKNLDNLSSKIKQLLDSGSHNPVQQQKFDFRTYLKNQTTLNKEGLKQSSPQDKYNKFLDGQFQESKMSYKPNDSQNPIPISWKRNIFQHFAQTPSESNFENTCKLVSPKNSIEIFNSANFVRQNLTSILEYNANDIEDTLKQLRSNRNKLKEQFNLEYQHLQGSRMKNLQNKSEPKKITAVKQLETKYGFGKEQKYEQRSAVLQISKDFDYRSENKSHNNFDFVRQVESLQIKETQSTQLKSESIQLPEANQRVEALTMAEALGKQVAIDHNMKQYRNQFCQYRDQGKWSSLRKQLQGKGIYCQPETLREELAMSSDEHNPFDEDVQQQISLPQCTKKLGICYKQAVSHWKKCVLGCVSANKLEEQGFTIKGIDLSRNGHLCIQDLVCFINLYSGNFFRNRDVVMLYRRLNGMHNPTSKLAYQDFLSVLTTV